MSWDFYIKHYADDERQQKDSKATWDTPGGELYIGNDPPAGSKFKGILYPRAGTLGGCGSHNALITLYPHESDWEHIQSITQDDSWSPQNMRKYFQKLERCRYLPNGIIGHGFNGWLTTRVTDLLLVAQDTQFLAVVVAAATALGKTLVTSLLSTALGLGQILLADINNNSEDRDSSTGLFQVPIATTEEYKRNGPREFILDTANAVDAEGNRLYHLDIRMHCLVTKIMMDNDNSGPIATGVEFLDGESLYRADRRAPLNSAGGIPGSVKATKEVILSAGVFNTPQVLKLSGIGPKDELESFAIPVVVDLPGVGTNMQDRYEIGVATKFASNFTITEKCTFQNDPEVDPCLKQYLNPGLLGKGVYGSSGLALSAVQKSTSAVDQPDSDLIMFGVPAFFTGYYQNYSIKGVADAKHFTWLTLKAHTRNNKGTVKLRSTDPRDVPEIVFNYFDTGVTEGGADDLDLQAMYEGVEYSRRVLKDILPTVGGHEEVWPGPDIQDEASTKDFIKREAWGHHASCTCPIGADDDPYAVLDGKFRVRGVKRLRVVDASVFSKIPGTFIAVPTYMISEKAADIIIADNA